MDHIKKVLSVVPVFLRGMPQSQWTANEFYVWLQEFAPSILTEAKFAPDSFFAAWVGALGMLPTKHPEDINLMHVAETRIRESQHKADRISRLIMTQISQETPALSVSLSKADLSAPVVLQLRPTAPMPPARQLSTPNTVSHPLALQSGSNSISSTNLPVAPTFQPTTLGFSRPSTLQTGTISPTNVPVASTFQLTTSSPSRPSIALQSGSGSTPSSKAPLSTFQSTAPSLPLPTTLQSAIPQALPVQQLTRLPTSLRPPSPESFIPLDFDSTTTSKPTRRYKRKPINPTLLDPSAKKRIAHGQYPSKHYGGNTIFVISDSDAESIDDMDIDDQDLAMNDYESESGWEDEDSSSSEQEKEQQSAPVAMRLGFKPMIDINLKCNNYIRQLCADIYSSGAQTLVFFDWDNQPVPEEVVRLNPRDSGIYSIIVQGRSSKVPLTRNYRAHGYTLTTPRPFKEAADHEMFMLVCSLLYAGILHDKIVVVVTADIGLENIMLYMNERSISSTRLTTDGLIPYLNRIVPGCFKDPKHTRTKMLQSITLPELRPKMPNSSKGRVFTNK